MNSFFVCIFRLVLNLHNKIVYIAFGIDGVRFETHAHTLNQTHTPTLARVRAKKTFSNWYLGGITLWMFCVCVQKEGSTNYETQYANCHGGVIRVCVFNLPAWLHIT